jgi:hypothetical protein
LRFRAGPIEARPYASFDFGQLAVQGRGNGLEHEGETRMFWFAAAQFEFTPRDVYRVVDAGLVAAVSLSFRLN